MRSFSSVLCNAVANGGFIMSVRGLRALLLACGSLGVLIAASPAANAGGLAIREQSAYGEGTSYAGVAAGGDLSTMFWNPAVMTQFAGIQSSSTYAGILPYSSHSPSPGNTYFGSLAAPQGGTGNTSNAALVPGTTFSYQINQNLWVGLSFNSPFGLSVSFPENWVGRDYGASYSNLTTYNVTPSVPYRINDWISIGAGMQIQYANLAFQHGLSAVVQPFPPIPFFGLAASPVDAKLSANGWGYGFTAGVTFTPQPATAIGLGYRSAIDQKFSGTLTLPPPALGGPGALPANLTVNAPSILSLGLRQRIDPQWTLLGTVEWTNWNRIGTSVISTPLPPSPFLTLPFQWKDGWLFSIGAEYKASDRLSLRTGFGYEISPVTDQVRFPIIPDNDRFWASIGASYQIWRGLVANLAYSHIFFRTPSINISAASGNPWFATSITSANPSGVAYIGSVQSHVDILSIGVAWRWDEVLGAGAGPQK